MGKRKNRSKRSVAKLPKGLAVRGGGGFASQVGQKDTAANPFEVTQRHAKRAKFQVHNRGTNTTNSQTNKKPSALAEALKRRQVALKAALKDQRKVNVYQDKRIGEYDPGMSNEDQNLARLVKERTRQSKKHSRYNLDDDDEDVLTHRGRQIDELDARNHIVLDDAKEMGGDLDELDTELHFGGLPSNKASTSIYGNSSSELDMSTLYSQHKKTELDDLILRRKIQKAERLKTKEEQVDKFEAMDDSFKELSKLLQFRDKETEIRQHIKEKREGKLTDEDQEFADWDKEMKEYMFLTRKVKATDRTKTPEEVAKEEAERLHELETRRLARMNGDFGDDDDLSDVSTDDDDHNNKTKKKRRKRSGVNKDLSPEALYNESSDEEEGDDEEHWQTRFTADGLVYVDKDGAVVGKVGEVTTTTKAQIGEEQDAHNKASTAAITTSSLHKVGDKVIASYRAKEQYGGNEAWFGGKVAGVHKNKEGHVVSYDIEYDDGDFEEDVEPHHVKPVEKTEEEIEAEASQKDKEVAMKRKRQKAKEKARTEIPFVFEVPTTLDALHDMVANYATTGDDVSLIIQRIHKANSIRLDRRNAEKMQNFYDVLIRRFVAVGDAIYSSGNGGDELARYSQLNSLTETLYQMAQESPNTAGAVWARRLGIFHSAHTKRLRDAMLETDDEEEFTAMPSTGVFLALRTIGHIFPVTDKRHYVASPTILFLGQIVSHTPILALRDLVMGLMCAGLLIQYTKDAKRIAPEAHAFLASVIRLFSPEQRVSYPLPTFNTASRLEVFSSLREKIAKCSVKEFAPQLSLEAESIAGDDMPAALLYAALHLADTSAKNLSGSLSVAEKETFAEITNSILTLNPTSKTDPLPKLIQTKVASVVSTLSSFLKQTARPPLSRQAGAAIQSIKTLAPRLENPDKYSMSKDKGKNATQAAADRARREYRREHKAAARELRLDGAFIENERRQEQNKKDTAAKAKRQKAFAWMEGEQATMNQQVRQGGGLLQGGGTGAGKIKAATGKLGIKKGGKFK